MLMTTATLFSKYGGHLDFRFLVKQEKLVILGKLIKIYLFATTLYLSQSLHISLFHCHCNNTNFSDIQPGWPKLC